MKENKKESYVFKTGVVDFEEISEALTRKRPIAIVQNFDNPKDDCAVIIHRWIWRKYQELRNIVPFVGDFPENIKKCYNGHIVFVVDSAKGITPITKRVKAIVAAKNDERMNVKVTLMEGN